MPAKSTKWMFARPSRSPPKFVPPKGRKQIWLPNFKITLLRRPHLPPNWATFDVPLRLNKLDLKDYLWHAYGVPVLRVRSYVQQQKVVADKPGALLPRRNRWYRPRAKKRMTVEMADEPGCGPFVWPEEVDDFEPWDKDVYDSAAGQREEQEERMQTKPPLAFEKDDRDTIKEQAKALLEGKEQWRPTWMDYGQMKDMEVDFLPSRDR